MPVGKSHVKVDFVFAHLPRIQPLVNERANQAEGYTELSPAVDKTQAAASRIAKAFKPAKLYIGYEAQDKRASERWRPSREGVSEQLGYPWLTTDDAAVAGLRNLRASGRAGI